MKKLDTSAISTSVGMPEKSGTLVHIQAAIQESVNGAILGLIGTLYDSTKTYILNGCIDNNGSISFGVVFFNGEVYYCPAQVVNPTGSNIIVGVINTSFYADVSADPVTFTDGVPRNVHQIRQIVWQAGLSGSGVTDFINLVTINSNQPNVNITGYSNANPNSGIAVISGTFPNFNIYVPAPASNTASLIWHGTIGYDGVTVNRLFGTLNVSSFRVNTGFLTITHNKGDIKYFVSGLGNDPNLANVSLRSSSNITSSTFQVGISDDASSNDCQIIMQIWGY